MLNDTLKEIEYFSHWQWLSQAFLIYFWSLHVFCILYQFYSLQRLPIQYFTKILLRLTSIFKLFMKPTIHFSHSLSVVKRFVKGECIKLASNTIDPIIMNALLNYFRAHLTKRGYSFLEMDPIFKQMINSNRAKRILKNSLRQSLRNPTVLVTKFDTCLKG